MDQPVSTADAPPKVPYTATEIFFVLFLLLIWPILVLAVFDSVHLFGRLYGAEAIALARASEDQREQQSLALGILAGPWMAQEGLPILRRLAISRFNLWTNVFSFPFQAASVPLVLYVISRTRPAQIGLTTHHLGRNLLAGLALFLVIAPIVLGLNYLVEWLYRRGLGGGTQVHPLTLIASQDLLPGEWVLLILWGVLTAPVLEELVFRGLLQPWLVARPWGGSVALALALGIAGAFCAEAVRAAWPRGNGAMLRAAAPSLFIVALLPPYLLVLWRSRGTAARGIFGTAALFAAIHSSVWPSPIALFVLALALGVLAWRTGSLAGPMLLHSLFNSIACVQLLWATSHRM
jgi:membrane protease YdiL (CAAX protease family)